MNDNGELWNLQSKNVFFLLHVGHLVAISRTIPQNRTTRMTRLVIHLRRTIWWSPNSTWSATPARPRSRKTKRRPPAVAAGRTYLLKGEGRSVDRLFNPSVSLIGAARPGTHESSAEGSVRHIQQRPASDYFSKSMAICVSTSTGIPFSIRG
jgi:hypothetical protein